MAVETRHSDGAERHPVQRLLIVEDDAAQLKTLSAIMQVRGFETDPCRTAAEAMEHFERDGADVVILDLHLPDASGIDVLRKLAESSNVPVILHTAFSSLESAMDAVNLGAFAYVEKGSDPNDLVHHVHRALQARLRQRAEDLEDAVAERTRELQQINEALRVSERRFKSLFEQAGDYILVLEPQPDGPPLIVDANEAAIEKHGFTRGEFIGKPISDLVDEANRKRSPERVKKLTAGEHLIFESNHVRKDGSTFPVEVSAKLLDVGEGPPLIISIERDITERKRAEQALRDSEERYRQVVSTTTDAVMVFDAETREFIEVNESCTTLYGYTRDEFLEMKQDDITDELADSDTTIRQTVAGQLHRIPLRYHKKKDGTVFPVEISASAFVLDGRQVACGLVRDITDRKKAEMDLESMKKRLELALQSANIGVWDWDLVTDEVYFSPEWKAHIGYAEDELPNAYEEWEGRLHGEDREQTLRALRAYREGQADKYVVEFRLRHKDGSYRWILAHGEMLLDDSGKPVRMTGCHLDITDRMQAEQALRKSEERYRTLVESSHDAIMTLEPPAWQFTACNPATVTLFRSGSEEAFVATSPWQLSPEYQPDGRGSEEKAKEMIETAMRNGDHFFEWRHKRSDGEEFPATVLLTRVQIEGQVFLQATVRDITDRKRAEEDIRNLAKFPSESPYPVLRIRSDGVILHANPSAARLLVDHALSTDELAPDDWQRCAVAAMESGAVVRREFHYDQETFAFHFAPLADARYVNVYGIDITEQKDLEAQLRQAQKMEAVGRLAGGIAHDFRNQLTVITGYADWMLSHIGADSQYAPHIREILDAANRSARLTGHLLVFSRREILEPKVVSPMALIDSLVAPLKHMIGEDVILVTSGADDLDNITVDPTQFEHMLVNLAVNARDAMPHGGELRIDFTPAELDSKHARRNIDAQPGKYVAITVSDTGVGMDAETRRNAFDPFFTTKPAAEGTGLGLSMAYGFVRQSGGYITVDSEVGHGTTFTIYLPATTERPREIESPDDADDTRADHATGTILAVEDDEQLRNMLVGILRESGHTVLTAGNAREALPIGEHYEGQIDLLITDVVMPGLSGVELAERLKAVRPDIAVILISGYGDSELLRRGLADGIAELMLKPFGADELLTAVNHILT
jgi:PAS domain S-box-containing protein